jgi:hypothetical protein
MAASRQRIALFDLTFSGRRDVHGTHNPETGKAWQVKRPVTAAVIQDHLVGRQPLGIYPLAGDRTKMVVIDFDVDDGSLPLAFVRLAGDLDLPGYIERSKSKGFHVWIFLDQQGVPAWKPRAVVSHILEEMGHPDTEVFPKHDKLTGAARYGNFINLPLFGQYAARGRTVFVDQDLRPYPDQWTHLRKIDRVPEAVLDAIIEKHKLCRPQTRRAPTPPASTNARNHDLPPCGQRMLREGVRANQRVACFRLAVQLRKAGNPFDKTVATLCAWAQRNRPADGKPIIRKSEIRSQTRWAYRGGYKGCGCEDPAVMPFCDPACPVSRRLPDCS